LEFQLIRPPIIIAELDGEDQLVKRLADTLPDVFEVLLGAAVRNAVRQDHMDGGCPFLPDAHKRLSRFEIIIWKSIGCLTFR
jgi:hypothetical protein